MAAPEGNQNAIGNKGANLNDRKRMAKLRGLVVDEAIRIFEIPRETLSDYERELKRDLLVKLAPASLPRLTEVTGEDGEPVKLVFDQAFNPNKGIDGAKVKPNAPTPQDPKGDSPKSS